ncbi:MAG: hypothetical protein MJZ38_00310 [archaeon]|nr:hypothetical protein [archaeon]
MHDSLTLGRITRISFALRRRLVETCGIPADAMTSNQRFRVEFVRRAVGAGCTPKDVLDDIRRGVFGNTVLIEVAFHEGRISEELRETYLEIQRVCVQKRCTSEEIPLDEWEKLLGIEK